MGRGFVSTGGEWGGALPLEFSFLNLKGLLVFIFLCSCTNVQEQEEREELEKGYRVP